jgi:oligoendopeptidase F
MATATQRTGAEEVEWNLGDLYAGPDDAEFERDLCAAVDEAHAFRERYAGRVGDLTAQELTEAVDGLERILVLLEKPTSFARLRFEADASDETSGRLLERAQEQETRVQTEVQFFELEWAALEDDEAERKLADDALAARRRFLSSIRRFRAHLLTEPEERIAAEKALTGITAWTRLHSDLLSQIRVQFDDEELSPTEARERLAVMTNRDDRARLDTAMGEALEPGIKLRSFVLNTIANDRAVEDRLRNYDSWIASRNLLNEIGDDAVQALVDAVTQRYDIAQRHFRLRARLLGLPRLASYDVYAPVAGEPPLVDWDAAAAISIDAYTTLSPVAGERVRRFFDGGWIDAAPRRGKVPGAFCKMRLPRVHPYILMTYSGVRASVMTLAHELGHGLHASLQELPYLDTEIALTLVEVPSVFGEWLAFDELRRRTDDPQAQLELLVSRIDEALMTVFVQVAYNRFENAVHNARRSEGELTADQLSDHFGRAMREYVGDTVELTPAWERRWSAIPHFGLVPGYVYAYAFGYLVATACYQRYREDRDGFVDAYLELLRAGGSRPPLELLRDFGFDVSDPAFWHRGLDAIEALIAEAESYNGGSTPSAPGTRGPGTPG